MGRPVARPTPGVWGSVGAAQGRRGPIAGEGGRLGPVRAQEDVEASGGPVCLGFALWAAGLAFESVRAATETG